MKVLLDTHVLIWFFEDDGKLSLEARNMITDVGNEVYFSSLSIFEVVLKNLNRPDLMPYTGEEIFVYGLQSGFKPLPLEIKHTLAVKNLTRKENSPQHRAPFDRLMLSQAIVEGMIFITHDERIAEYVTDSVYKI